MRDSFISPTRGELTFEQMFADILSFLSPNTGPVKLIVGTDSHTRDDLLFVTAIIVHRVGKGARYYYRKRRQRKIVSLRQKIFYEASLSLAVASRLAERLSSSGISDQNLEIHLDVGQAGETKDLIREVVGMITGSGFDARIKPDSYGASKVADKHTK